MEDDPFLEEVELLNVVSEMTSNLGKAAEMLTVSDLFGKKTKPVSNVVKL